MAETPLTDNVTEPDLNFPPWESDYAQALEEARSRVEHLRRAGAMGPRHEERRQRWLKVAERDLAQREKMCPAVDRVRTKPQTDPRLYRRTTASGAIVVHRAGQVEIVNPDYDYDFRVEVRWNEETEQLEPSAVAVIARPGGEAVPADMRGIGVAGAIRDAVRHLTIRKDLDETGFGTRGTTGDSMAIMRNNEGDRPSRTSPAQVRRDEQTIAELWWRAHVDDPKGRGVRKWIQGRCDPIAKSRVPELIAGARRNGLIPSADGSTRPAPPSPEEVRHRISRYDSSVIE